MFTIGIQARATSTRLPGKVLFNLGNCTVIEWSILQAKTYFPLAEIYILVPNDEYRDIFKNIAEKHQINFIVGSTGDVLSRYEALADHVNTDWIVRWTADNPIKCQVAVDKLLRHVDATAEYIAYRDLRKTAFEIVRRSTLQLHRKSKNFTNSCQEHVTWGIRKHHACKYLIPNKAINISKKVDDFFTIDTPADYITISNFIERYKLVPTHKVKLEDLS
jgi:spore coat polysaccharide biosynthesis protein SpsF